jgi:hypothetical protein
MAPDGKRMRPWVKDVAVFVGMTVLNLILILPCGVILTLSDSPKKGFGVSDLWYWVFATPPMTAAQLGWYDLAKLLALLNPLIYGATWWLLWRVVKMWRTKPAE